MNEKNDKQQQQQLSLVLWRGFLFFLLITYKENNIIWKNDINKQNKFTATYKCIISVTYIYNDGSYSYRNVEWYYTIH